MLVFIYIGLALLVGLLGWNRKLGFFIHFLLAMLLTPLVMLVYHVLARIWEARQREKQELLAPHTRIIAEEMPARGGRGRAGQAPYRDS